MMDICFYSIIQFVPDPLSEERVNIGVLVVDGDRVDYRFLSNWKRAESFARPSTMEITKSFREELELICLKAQNSGQMMLTGSNRSPADTIRSMVSEWSNQVQFTELRPSMEYPNELIERLSKQFLIERTSAKRDGRSRGQIMFGAHRHFRDSISDHDPQHQSHLEARVRHGSSGTIVQDLTVDVALLNGQLHAASEAVSFQTADVQEINFQWRESIYTLVDLKENQPWVNTAIVVAPPFADGRSVSAWQSEYDSARQSAERNKINVIDESELHDWADEQVRLALKAS